MPHPLDAVAASPWILVVVFVVAALDALLPFMPSEWTVVAGGVAAAATGRPHLLLLVTVAAAGAYAGDALAYRIGRRGTGVVTARLSHRRAIAAHGWVSSLLHRRGGLLVVTARYLPGGRSTTALAAGVVGYPARRFHAWTAAGVLVWAVQAALLGYLGGALFVDRPLLGFLVAGAAAMTVTGLAVGVQRIAAGPAGRAAGRRQPEPSA